LLCSDELYIQVTHLSCDHGADLMLNKEARKWSAKVVRDMRTIRDKTKEVNQLLDQIHAAKVFFDITFVNELCAVVELIEICVAL